MPDDKSLGRRLLGLFVEAVPAPDAAPSPEAGERSAADEIAAIAKTASQPPAPDVLARARQPAAASTPVAPAQVDFDAVFKNAGLDPEALGRVRKAEDLLKTLPTGAADDVKRQIVEAALKAFGYETAKIVEAVQTQTRALDAYVRVNEQQTAKAITEAQAQIAKLEDQVITLRAEIDKRTDALAALAAAADVRKQQVTKVLDFFQAAPAQADAAAASTSDD